jgi:sulfonate transport system substrate-binding protein
MENMRIAMLSALLACLLAALAPARAEPLNIRAGWAVVPAQLTSILFEKKELAKHLGVSYTYEPIHFKGSAPQITALAAGEIDIAALAFSSFGLAIQNAHMNDIRVIGDLYQDAVDGYYTSQYVVLADSPIKTIEDLKGKVLASNGLGGAIDMAMRKELRDHGMEDKRDYQIVEIEFPNMLPALQENKVALVGLVTPYSIEAEQKGITRTLFTIKDSMGETQTTLMAARQGFIAKNHAALVDFFEDLQRATRWYLDPKNHDEAVAIAARFTKSPPALYADWLFTKKDYYHDPDGRPNLKALQHNLKDQKDLGFLKIDIDVTKFADLSLIDDATKRPR